MGAPGHTSERGRCAIPGSPAPSRLLWTAAPWASPWSFPLVAYDVPAVPGPPPVPPSAPNLLVSPPVSARPSAPPGGRPIFRPSGIPLGPWESRLSVLWLHRTPSSSQGPSWLGRAGTGPPASPAGDCYHAPTLPPSILQRVPGQRSTECTPLPVHAIHATFYQDVFLGNLVGGVSLIHSVMSIQINSRLCQFKNRLNSWYLNCLNKLFYIRWEGYDHHNGHKVMRPQWYMSNQYLHVLLMKWCCSV